MSVACRFPFVTRLVLGSLSAITFLPACRTRHAVPVVVIASTWPSPVDDASPNCSDVGDQRVCWRAPPDGAIIVIRPRPTPPLALSSLGWRCSGAGALRRCVDRARDATPFVCDGAHCVQRRPRLPDDGEWECADFGGAVVCRSSARAAGVPPGAPSPGFTCGTRRGPHASPDERICVDLSPDFPNGVPRGVRCHFAPENGLTRVCDLDPSAHGLADLCDRMHPCVSGLSCVTTRCVPALPMPSCWLDDDCDNRACRFGSCTEGAP